MTILAIALAFVAGMIFMFLIGRLATLWLQQKLKRDPAVMEKVMERVRRKIEESK